jgi:serine protease AprX
MDAGVGNPSTYIECLQFFVAPTDLQGKNPRIDLRPHSMRHHTYQRHYVCI